MYLQHSSPTSTSSKSMFRDCERIDGICRQQLHCDLEAILAQKIQSRGDSCHINIVDFYNVLRATKGERLAEIYTQFYDGNCHFDYYCNSFHTVLHVNIRKDSDNLKVMRNNINFKIKNMLESYPLKFTNYLLNFIIEKISPFTILW